MLTWEKIPGLIHRAFLYCKWREAGGGPGNEDTTCTHTSISASTCLTEEVTVVRTIPRDLTILIVCPARRRSSTRRRRVQMWLYLSCMPGTIPIVRYEWWGWYCTANMGTGYPRPRSTGMGMDHSSWNGDRTVATSRVGWWCNVSWNGDGIIPRCDMMMWRTMGWNRDGSVSRRNIVMRRILSWNGNITIARSDTSRMGMGLVGWNWDSTISTTARMVGCPGLATNTASSLLWMVIATSWYVDVTYSTISVVIVTRILVVVVGKWFMTLAVFGEHAVWWRPG